MNPIALARNIQSSLQICPTWIDRVNYLLWLYSSKWFVKAFINPKSRHHKIQFSYENPIDKIQVAVRNNYGSDAFIFSEVFGHRYYDFPLPFQPVTILDLGANVGFTAIFFARKYPFAQIACVEPMPNNLKMLEENLESNDIKATIFPSAVAIADGFLQMVVDTHDYGHKVADIEYGKAIQGEILEVTALSVPTLMKKLSWERISLLKVDVEGYEAVLLKEDCEWLAFVDAICIECHEGYGEADLRALAQAWGFVKPQQLPGNWLLVRKNRVTV
jgi:FkbM family methyltransferase